MVNVVCKLHWPLASVQRRALAPLHLHLPLFLSDPQPGHEGKGSPHLAPAATPSFGPAAVVGSLAAIGALGGQSGLADPGAFGGRQVTGGARKQQPAKPVPLRPPLGMAQQQQQQQQGALLRVKQNPDEDVGKPGGAVRRKLVLNRGRDPCR
jgi:hypothetical protein